MAFVKNEKNVVVPDSCKVYGFLYICTFVKWPPAITSVITIFDFDSITEFE